MINRDVNRDPTPTQLAAEEEARRECETAWAGTLGVMPTTSALDWYLHTGGKMRAWVEAKVRNNPHDKYDDVWLSVNKYLALTFAELAFGVPGVFVVKFQDGIRFIRVRDVDARNVGIASRLDRGHPGDTEPVVFVPVADMKEIAGS